MKTLNIKISKTHVFDEVARQTAYIGAKMAEERPGSFERITVTDADRDLLERYWQKASTQVTALLRPFIVSLNEQPYVHGTEPKRNYIAQLTVSDRYEDNLTDSLITSIMYFFINTILSEWCMLTNKEEAAGYVAGAQANLEDAKMKLYHKKAPKL